MLFVQIESAYVDQIPSGVPRPSPAASAPHAANSAASTGVYAQMASVTTRRAAAQAGIETAARLGELRPNYIRSVVAVIDGRPHIRMYAGPFASENDARAACEKALAPGDPCLMRIFNEPPSGASLKQDPR